VEQQPQALEVAGERKMRWDFKGCVQMWFSDLLYISAFR